MSFPHFSGAKGFFARHTGDGRTGLWWLRGGSGLLVVIVAALAAFAVVYSGQFLAGAQSAAPVVIELEHRQNGWVSGLPLSESLVIFKFNKDLDNSINLTNLPDNFSFTGVASDGVSQLSPTAEQASIGGACLGGINCIPDGFPDTTDNSLLILNLEARYGAPSSMTVNYVVTDDDDVLKDTAGNKVQTFNYTFVPQDQFVPPVLGPPDTTAPTLESTSLQIDQDEEAFIVTLTFDEELSANSRPDGRQFEIDFIANVLGEDGQPTGETEEFDLHSSDASVVIGDTEAITGTATPSDNRLVYVRFYPGNVNYDFTRHQYVEGSASVEYVVPTEDPLQDLSTNLVAAFKVPVPFHYTDPATPTPIPPTPILEAVLPGSPVLSGPSLTLVSNIGQPDGLAESPTLESWRNAIRAGHYTNVGNKFRAIAVPFTTGREFATLTEVDIVLYDSLYPLDNYDPYDYPPRISIYTTDSSGFPDASLYELENPDRLNRSGTNTFTVPSDSRRLRSNTTYAIVIRMPVPVGVSPSPQGMFLWKTLSTDEDPDGQTGWSIGDKRYFQDTDLASRRADPWKVACDPDDPDQVSCVITDFADYDAAEDNVLGIPRITIRGGDLKADAPPPEPTGTSFLLSSECDSKLFLTWNSPRSDIARYEIRWMSGDDMEQVTTISDPEAASYTLDSLTNGTTYTIRVNGLISRSTIPVWSEQVESTPSSMSCISGVRYGGISYRSILADGAPVIADLEGAEPGERVNLRYRSVDPAPGAWSEGQTMLLKEGESSVSFEISEVDPGAWHEMQMWIGATSSPPGAGDSAVQTFFLAGDRAPVGIPRISRVEPSIRDVTVSQGDRIRLSFDIYGRQGILNNDLGENLAFVWDIRGAGGRIAATNRANTVIYTAPENAGTDTVTVTAPTGAGACLIGDDVEDRCTAKFTIRVRRSSAPQPTVAPLVNPPGDIPGILSDADGNQYEVFTPVDGGTFDAGAGYSITAAPGAVPNGEFIGIRMSDDGVASNAGITRHRYTLGGNMYGIHAVDSAEAVISSYVLDDPATVCLPLPAELGRNISDLAVVAINGDGSLTILSASVRISTSGTMVCGGLSKLPASVAVGSAGAPAAIPTPMPDPTAEVPDTGGTAPGSSSAVLWALLLGMAVLALGGVLVIGSRRRGSSMWKSGERRDGSRTASATDH